MKILVTVKRVIDHNVKIKIKTDKSDVDLSNTKMAINPFCEIAIEEAIRIKEKAEKEGITSEVIAVSVGTSLSQSELRTALALGVDRAILIETESNIESLNVAKILSKVVENEQPDLVILGKQAIDTDNNQTGQMLAALTGMPQGTFASAISINNSKISVTREIDGGMQTLELNLPAIVTTDLRLNEPRYASLPNIMKAKRKPLLIKTPEDYGVIIKQHCKLLGVDSPAKRQTGIMVESVSELVNQLKNEAKVI
ncbi:electron transfer flavoprotein subunit beta/FixA family protein [Dasania marina]|uniref:electron transfer flavoprotein subunit beta/FixA family protein n=1 Tax=Dasania marina TaxID=471499 RepID=UPI0030D765FE|tara:strand:- start:73 stop:834 length:762 start_codon:yes stop_codon:yes gene_type:complete